jgi:hypothetical protein
MTSRTAHVDKTSVPLSAPREGCGMGYGRQRKIPCEICPETS